MSQLPQLLISNLEHLGVMKVTGDERLTFLQGQVTSDLLNQAHNVWQWGAHCDPKGKMLAAFRSLVTEDAVYLIMPRSTLALDLPQLKKYSVFNKVEINDISDEVALVGIAGSQADAFMAEHFGEISEQVTLDPQHYILRDQSPIAQADEHSSRYMVMIYAADYPALVAKQAEAESHYSAWQTLEILAGYPNFSGEHSGKYVPQMCNLQALEGISFKKGCYIGQETVARMKYRGGNKRALYIAQGKRTAPITDESQVEVELEAGSFRKAGEIIELAHVGEQVFFSIVMANDTELTAKLRLSDQPDEAFSLLALPYSLAD